MSSRLFQEVRENRGLAYSVYSYLPTYIDTGLFVVYAGTSEKSFQEVIELILQEFKHLKKDPFRNRELETAKEQLKGNLLLSLESSDNLMTRLAKNEIYFDSYVPMEAILQGIEDVKEETMRSLANEFFDQRYFCLTVLGPMDEKRIDRVCSTSHDQEGMKIYIAFKKDCSVSLPRHMTGGLQDGSLCVSGNGK
jgi:predicted Zn-dependent peptidase